MPRIDRPKTMIPYLEKLQSVGIAVSGADIDTLIELSGTNLEHTCSPIVSLNVSGGVIWGQRRKEFYYIYGACPSVTAPVCNDGDVWIGSDVYAIPGVIGARTMPKPDPVRWSAGVWGWRLHRTGGVLVRICADNGVLFGGHTSDGAYIPWEKTHTKQKIKWGMVPEHYILGAAALWRERPVKAAGGYWGLPKAVIRRQCEIRGWCQMASSGKIMTKPGVYRSCVGDETEEAYAAYAKGLREPRIWPVGAIEALARQSGPDKQDEGCAAFYDAMSEWCFMEAEAGYMTTTADMQRYVAEKKKNGWLT